MFWDMAWAQTILPESYPPGLIIAGAVSILVGLFLCFCGKRFFKPFLALVGFVAGFGVGLFVLLWIDAEGKLAQSWFLLIPVVVGIVVAGLCLWIVKMAILCGAAAGGFALGMSLMSVRDGALIPHSIGRLGFLAAIVAICVVLAWFFETLIVCITSAALGAFMAVSGVDLFAKTGFLEAALEAVQVREVRVKVTMPLLGMCSLVLGLAAAGIVTQYLHIRRSGGSLKGGRTPSPAAAASPKV
jgi:hypothetical protein